MTPKNTILLVDDEHHVTLVMRQKLEASGFRVIVAMDGQEGLELAESEQPSLIVSDYEMPNCTGLEMAIRLATIERTSQIPIILLTSRSFRIEAKKIAQTRICQVVGKPFSPRQLSKTIKTLLRADACHAD